MTVAEIIAYARQLTKTTPSQFSDDTLLSFLKVRLHELQRIVAQTRQDYFGEISTTDGVLDQEDYALPEDAIEIERLDVCYDYTGADTDKWNPANEVDIGQLDKSWNYYQQHASEANPIYDIVDQRIYLAPIRTANVGSDAVIKLKLWYIKRPPDPTTTSDTPLISTSNKALLDYQPLLSDGVALDILRSLGSARTTEFNNSWLSGLGRMRAELKQQNIGVIEMPVPKMDGTLQNVKPTKQYSL